nr:MAG TPA: hypothetical protein [Caudoviricetes sp.]
MVFTILLTNNKLWRNLLWHTVNQLNKKLL